MYKNKKYPKDIYLKKLNQLWIPSSLGSCPPNAIPTFNGQNAIRNNQMIFINKANHHFDEKRLDNTHIKWSNSPLEEVRNLQ